MMNTTVDMLLVDSMPVAIRHIYMVSKPWLQMFNMLHLVT